MASRRGLSEAAVLYAYRERMVWEERGWEMGLWRRPAGDFSDDIDAYDRVNGGYAADARRIQLVHT